MHYQACDITKYDAPHNIAGATEYAHSPPPVLLPESKHVLMAKIGLDTSDSGYVGVAHSLLAEVVDYLQSCNEVLWFKWMGNNKRGAAHIIPKSSGRKTFKEGVNKKGWLEAITEFIVSDSTDVDADDAAYWIMESLADKHEESFFKLANKYGLLAPKVMSERTTAAMISDASLTVNQARIITKHTKAAFGKSILCAVRKFGDETVKKWQNEVSPPIFSQYEFRDPKKVSVKPCFKCPHQDIKPTSLFHHQKEARQESGDS
jgi:hypothetical protein